MVNILIVDDNKNNRMILRLLLEDYMEENSGIDFFIDEAEDGQIAVNKCESKEFDIVLMDIMMPNMDGIEATKIIRQKYKKIMIIAVSAVDDGERKKLILNNGAEDYIAKPVNADIFISRMANYIALSETRKTKKVSAEVCANLFTKNIFSRHMRFIITSEDGLSEFWEYYLLSSDMKCDDLSDVVRTVFAICELQRRLNINSDIFVEDSEYKKYFTISNITDLPKKVVELTLKKNNYAGKYKIENSKISFELDITYFDNQELLDEIVEEKKVEIIPVKPVEVVPDTIMASGELVVQDYMYNDDLFDLEEFGNKLNSIMLLVSNGGITEEEVVEIYTYLEKIGSILTSYSEVYPISLALTQLAVDMQNNSQTFIDNSEALGPMCKAFSNDMSNWIEMSFHTGAPSAEFMNDTIVVNAQTIGSMLTMNDTPVDGGDDFDDIFDF